jgi:phage repressor protein C with HTH and peptisase S24 domain
MNLQAIYDRITERREALGLSESAASKRAGLSADAIRNIRRALEGGKEDGGVSTRTLNALAPVLETTAEWLMTQQGEKVAIPPPDSDVVPAVVQHTSDRMDRDLPVYGSAKGSLVDGVEGIEIFSTTAVDYVRRPAVLVNVPGAYAVYVSGDSMDPAHPNGALRLVHPHRPVSPGDTVIVQTRHYDGAPPQGYIKVLRRRSGDRLLLEQYNPAAKIEIPIKYVVSVHKVLDMNDLYG